MNDHATYELPIDAGYESAWYELTIDHSALDERTVVSLTNRST